MPPYFLPPGGAKCKLCRRGDRIGRSSLRAGMSPCGTERTSRDVRFPVAVGESGVTRGEMHFTSGYSISYKNYASRENDWAEVTAPVSNSVPDAAGVRAVTERKASRWVNRMIGSLRCPHDSARVRFARTMRWAIVAPTRAVAKADRRAGSRRPGPCWRSSISSSTKATPRREATTGFVLSFATKRFAWAARSPPSRRKSPKSTDLSP